MQWRFFHISVYADEEEQERFNCFLRSVKVLCVQREFVQNGDKSCWALAVEYLPHSGTKINNGQQEQKKRIDYREQLSADDFALFAILRDWRKEIAQQEGVPVYTVFTNEQLAEIARNRCDSKAALQKIAGVGNSRVAKYGQLVLEVVQKEPGNTSSNDSIL